MSSKRRENKLKKAAMKQGMEELKQLNAELIANYRVFNLVSDPIAMETCIYEINALRSRRDSVLHDMRSME